MQWLTTAGLIGGPAIMAANEVAPNVLPGNGITFVMITMMGAAVTAMWKRSCRSDQVIIDLTKALTELKSHCASKGEK